MKIKNLLTAALMLMFSIGVFGQYSVNLNGIVMNAQTGQATPNQTITWWFSPNAPISGGPTGTIVTDSMGMFSDSISVFTPSGWFLLTTTNCDGSTLNDSLYFQINTTGNFITTLINYCDTGNYPPPPPMCDASFTHGPNPSGQGTIFTMNFPNPQAIYLWDFGDGSYDTTQFAATQHMYMPSGTNMFTACVTMVAGNCIDSSCSLVTINNTNPNQVSTILGSVDVGNIFATDAIVYLIEFDTASGGILAAVDTSSLIQGTFEFDSVPNGFYLLKAALNPSDPDYQNFLPTYFAGSSPIFGASSSLFWFQAMTVPILTPGTIFFAQLNMIPGNNPGGPGFIGGLISQGANKTVGPGDGIENVLVLLLDNNDNPVDYTYSDKDGKFEFASIPYGDYKLYTEVSGLTTQEVFVTVDAQNPKVDLVDVIISSSGVNGTVGVRKISKANEVAVYPNPVKDNLTIDLGEGQNGTIQIIDLAGKVIISETLNSNIFNVDLQNLSSGIYCLSISSQGKLHQSKLIKDY